MPINVAQGPAINNRFVPNQAQKTSAQAAIAQLEYAQIWRGAGTLVDNQVVRVDMQGTIAGPPIQHNIQVRIDGVRGNSTVADVNVSATLMTNDPANQRGVLRKVISALNQSLDTARTYTVTGTAP